MEPEIQVYPVEERKTELSAQSDPLSTQLQPEISHKTKGVVNGNE
jgi:hypothetical protein